MICAGGGGIPTMYEPGADRKLVGVEAVIDKDFCSELLARELDADLFVMATDADAVYVDWGKPKQRAIHEASPEELAKLRFRPARWAPRWRPPVASRRPPARRPRSARSPTFAAIARGERGTLVSRRFPGITHHR